MEWVYTTFNQFWPSYIVIFILTAIIYKVAFAIRLPLLKSVIIYVLLAVGCYLFTIMHLFRFPIIPALAITVAIIVVARLRMIGRDRKRSRGSKR